MYLEGTIEVDPAELTEIVRQKPTKAFGKIAAFLTAGAASPKEEVETFGALSILQQIYRVLRSMGIDDVVRIAKDDTVFFEDREGRSDDLKDAMQAFANDLKPEDKTLFERLTLVLQHQRGELDFLIDVKILRRHVVGQYPIRLTINGMPAGLNSLTDIDEIHRQFSPIFATQEAYQEFVETHQVAFTAYLDDMKRAFEKTMQVDHVIVQSKTKVLRPANRDSANSRHDFYDDGDDYSPVHRSCCHHDNSFFYAWLWADYLHSSDIHCSNVTLVDQEGHDVVEIGQEGFQPSNDSTLDTNQPFVLPNEGVQEVHQGHQFESQIETNKAATEAMASSNAFVDPGDTSEKGGGGWLSSIGDWASDAFSSDGDSGGGSSCGSSCGGCGGD